MPYTVVVVASTLLAMVVVAVEFAVVELEVVDVEVLVLKRKRKFLQDDVRIVLIYILKFTINL